MAQFLHVQHAGGLFTMASLPPNINSIPRHLPVPTFPPHRRRGRIKARWSTAFLAHMHSTDRHAACRRTESDPRWSPRSHPRLPALDVRRSFPARPSSHPCGVRTTHRNNVRTPARAVRRLTRGLDDATPTTEFPGWGWAVGSRFVASRSSPWLEHDVKLSLKPVHSTRHERSPITTPRHPSASHSEPVARGASRTRTPIGSEGPPVPAQSRARAGR